MKKICIYFKAEVSEPLIDLGKYDGLCLKRKKGDHVLKENCMKGARCKSWADKLYESPKTPF
jgi:hypothetical protein